MLKHRIITAIIAIPILLMIILYLPLIYFAILMAVAVAIGAWEWSTLIGYSNKRFQYFYIVAVLLGLILAYWLPALPLLAIGTLMLLWGLTAIVRYQNSEAAYAFAFQFPEIKVMVGMLIFIPFWIGLLVLKSSSPLGPIWLLLAVVVVWVADSAAYFFGRAYGKHKLIPKVSPNKSWEGLIGGVVSALVVTIIFSFFMYMSWPQRLILWCIALIAILFSVVGDLQVSLLKRLVGKKDCGHLIPGHGGILDRIDSLTAGIIIFAFGLLLAGI